MQKHGHHCDYQRVLHGVAQPRSAQRFHERRINKIAVIRNGHTGCNLGVARACCSQVPQLHSRALAGGGVALAQGKGDGRQRCDACRVRGGGFGCHEAVMQRWFSLGCDDDDQIPEVRNAVF